jgi:hypothetical protein
VVEGVESVAAVVDEAFDESVAEALVGVPVVATGALSCSM